MPSRFYGYNTRFSKISGKLSACTNSGYQALSFPAPKSLGMMLVVVLPHKLYEYQVLCYCSLAKPDPHTKRKTLVSHNRYGIVFMHGQNVMADISAQSQSFHFGLCASWSSVTAWSHNLSSNLASSDPEFWPSHHDARKGGNTKLAWSKSLRHIVASTTLNNSTSYTS